MKIPDLTYICRDTVPISKNSERMMFCWKPSLLCKTPPPESCSVQNLPGQNYAAIGPYLAFVRFSCRNFLFWCHVIIGPYPSFVNFPVRIVLLEFSGSGFCCHWTVPLFLRFPDNYLIKNTLHIGLYLVSWIMGWFVQFLVESPPFFINIHFLNDIPLLRNVMSGLFMKCCLFLLNL